MVDDLEERLTRYRVDLDDAVTADLARRHLASRDAGPHDADPFPPDTDHWIRLEPAMSASVDRRRVKSVVIATLGVAAAVVAIVVVATRDDDAVNPADEPSPIVTVTPTPPPRALLLGTHREQFEPGTYFVDNVDGTPTARIFVTIGAGWMNLDGEGLGKAGKSTGWGDGTGVINFDRPAAVFSDACHPSDGYYPGPVNTLDGLVVALSEQRGWAHVTAPSDISIDGYAGKAFQRTAPADMSDCDTMAYSPRVRTGSGPYPVFLSWENDVGDSFLGGGPYEQDQIETVWVLDLDGTVVLINTRPYPEASAAVRAEFAAVLDSIRIDQA